MNQRNIPMKIIAEIGINHNGDLDIAKQLIDVAHDAGADMVKFQKRSIELVYSREFLDAPRQSPWGTTQRDQKEGLEFGQAEYEQIDKHCRQVGIEWFASAWDLESQEFLNQFNLKYNKIASAMLSNIPLLEAVAEEDRYTFISTGMHEIEEIESAVSIFRDRHCSYELMHCCSIYPLPIEHVNLGVIETLRRIFNCNIGYSGHETGLAVSVAAAALGITSLERHITLDRAMPGSDQAASIEPVGLVRLIRMVRAISIAMGNSVKEVTDEERVVRNKLAPLEFPYEL